jgi:hypothetical protein
VTTLQEIKNLYAEPWMAGIEDTRATSTIPLREAKAILLRPWSLRFTKDAKNDRTAGTI